MFVVLCLCGGVACAPLKGVDLPSANAVGQLVNVAATTSVTGSGVFVSFSPPILIVADNVTEAEHQAVMVKQTADYGDSDDRPADLTALIAKIPAKRS